MPVAEKLRQTIESLSIEGNSITISLGLATHEPLDCITSPEQLTRLADNALYRAKQSGKNRVEHLPADSLFHS